MSLGKRLKEARKSTGVTQEELAKMIGTSRGVITNLEHDKIETPQPLIINAVCNFLKINKEWLLNEEGEMCNGDDISQNHKVLSDIYSIVKELSEDEQRYILDVITSYKKHIIK